MTFQNLKIKESILKAVDELGFVEATKVQREAIPLILDNNDVIVMAKTGSGKTGAFSIPIIQSIEDKNYPQALILTPTRELAVQVEKEVKALAKFSTVKSVVVYGQHSLNTEINQLKKGPQLVVGTPGRVLHHIQAGHLKTGQMKYLVLDEADRMLDMGFIDQMIKIIKKMPRERQTLMFSATMPDAIQRMSRSYMNDPTTIAIDTDTKTVDAIDQGYYRVEHNQKRTQLNRIITVKNPKSCMVFCNTRIEVDKVKDYLDRKGFVAEAIHGANTQSKRMRTIDEFKKGEIQILVATDVAARGIHIDDLELVINYDVPMDKDNYIHRVGRTGRAGQEGQAVTLVTSDDLYTFYEIEEHAGARIDELDLPSEDLVQASLDQRDDYWAKKKAERDKRRQHHKKAPQHHKRQNQRRSNRPKQHHSKSNHASSSKDTRKTHQGKVVQKKVHPVKTQEAKKVHVPKETVVKKQVQTPVATPKKVKKKFSLKTLFKKK